MKFKITLLFIFSFTMLFAQSSDRLDYRLEAEKGDLNYYQILKKKKEEIKTYDLSVRSNTKTIKHFKRWEFFWKDRVDANGNFPNANQGFYNANILDENGKINKEDFVFQKSQISKSRNVKN